MTPDLRTLINRVSLPLSLEPSLVAGQVMTESGGNPYAWNPEPAYRYLWDVRKNAPFRTLSPDEIRSKIPPADFPSLVGDPDQEWWAQSASWGLLQIMGAVARELGYKEPYLTQLVDSETNLTLGCKKLASLLTWANGNVSQALAAYNGGKLGNVTPPFRNAAYAAKVLAAQQKIRGEFS